MQATLVQLSPNFCFEAQDESGNELEFVQTDWGYPPLAQRFGWSVGDVQQCRKCHKPLTLNEDDTDNKGDPLQEKCENCNRRKGNFYCDHSGTDGTVDCRDCGVTATDFISAAYDFLSENDGTTAEWNE